MRQSWMSAGDVEYRYRAWVLAAVFFGAFELYWWDHITAAAALDQWVAPHRGGNAGAWEKAILFFGAGLTVAAAALRTWAAAYMRSDIVHDPRVHDSRLVADGPYRYVRNPLYLGTILLGFGFAGAASRAGFVVLVAGVALFSYRLTLREERALMATQGERYRRYLAAVPRMFPSLWPRVPAAGMEPQWGQAISGELFMWAFAAIFVFYVATGNLQVLMWGSIAGTALVLLMRRWSAGLPKKQTAHS